MHGALLVAFVVAGLGVFVAFSWLLARLLGPRTSQPQLDPRRLASALLARLAFGLAIRHVDRPGGACGRQARSLLYVNMLT